MKEYGKWSEEAKQSKKVKIEEAKKIFNSEILETKVIIKSLELIYVNSNEENKLIIGKAINKLNGYINEQEKNIVLRRCL